MYLLPAISASRNLADYVLTHEPPQIETPAQLLFFFLSERTVLKAFTHQPEGRCAHPAHAHAAARHLLTGECQQKQLSRSRREPGTNQMETPFPESPYMPPFWNGGNFSSSCRGHCTAADCWQIRHGRLSGNVCCVSGARTVYSPEPEQAPVKILQVEPVTTTVLHLLSCYTSSRRHSYIHGL